MSRQISFKPYSKESILSTVNQLHINQENDGTIVTTFNDRCISRSKRTDKYGVFNFTEFIHGIIPSVETLFKPHQQFINITGGIQEIRLLGESKIINGDTFHQLLSVFSSSDGTKALTLAAGLCRLVCTNGMVIGIQDEYANMKSKHFLNTMPEKVQLFLNKVESIPIGLEHQELLLNEMNNKTISLKKLANNLVFVKGMDGEIKENKSMRTAVQQLAYTLIYSKTDKLDSSVLTREQKNMMYGTYRLYEPTSTVDIELPAYKTFNCYLENYRDKDMSIISKESKRIYSAMEL